MKMEVSFLEAKQTQTKQNNKTMVLIWEEDF